MKDQKGREEDRREHKTKPDGGRETASPPIEAIQSNFEEIHAVMAGQFEGELMQLHAQRWSGTD